MWQEEAMKNKKSSIKKGNISPGKLYYLITSKKTIWQKINEQIKRKTIFTKSTKSSLSVLKRIIEKQFRKVKGCK